MGIFNKVKETSSFFEQERLDNKFDGMMVWIKDLSRKDYNRLKKAMDLAYDAYQALHGIEPDVDTETDKAEFILHKEEE